MLRKPGSSLNEVEEQQPRGENMQIKEGQIILDNPTKEINIWIEIDGKLYKATIFSATQDQLGRTYIKVRKRSETRPA
jgi:hypothetical protein